MNSQMNKKTEAHQIQIYFDPLLAPIPQDLFGSNLIDWKLAEKTDLYHMLFRDKEDIDFHYHMKYAYVKLDRFEMCIPYNELTENETMAFYYKSPYDDEIEVLPKDKAVKVNTCFYLMFLIISAALANVYHQPNARIYSIQYLAELLEDLKEELFDDNQTRKISFHLFNCYR